MFNDVKSEKCIIGCCIDSNSIAKRVFSELTAEYFSSTTKILIKICRKSYQQTGKCSKQFVEDYLESKLDYEKYEKMRSFFRSCHAMSNTSEFDYYISSIRNSYYKKKANNIGEKLVDKTKEDDTTRDDIDNIFEDFRNIKINENNENNYKTSKQIRQDADPVVRIETADPILNDKLYRHGGLGLGEMEIICMISGHGKTFYSMKKGKELAMAGHRGAIFFLEDRPISASNRIDAMIDPDKYPEQNGNFLVVNRRRYLDQIVSDVLQMKYNEGIKWFIIDHLGKCRLKNEYRRQVVQREFASTLSDLAIDENLLAHINVQTPKSSRQGVDGWAKAPSLEDVKGAGEIIEDSVVVTTGFRPNNVPELTERDLEGNRFVKDANDNMVNFNSLFIRQVKNRRIALDAMQWFPMIQVGKQLFWKSQAEQMGYPFRKQDAIQTKKEQPKF